MIFRARIVVISILFPLLFSEALTGQGINTTMRSMDDNHYLACDSADNRLFRSIKEIHLKKETSPFMISFGGEIREQIRAYNNLQHGDAVPDQDIFLLQRYMIHTDISISRTFRFFGQLNSTFVNGKNSPGANDHDRMGVMQAFLDINFHHLPLRVRLGRQEIYYGSEKILGVREGPNNRMTYTGMRSTFSIKNISADFLLICPPDFKPGFFDNQINFNNIIYGTYWTIPTNNDSYVDLYYLANIRKDSRVSDIISDEKRYSFGARLSKTSGSLYYDAEATWQAGSFDVLHISAWHMSCLASYTWSSAHLNPRLQIKGSAYSGESDSLDKHLNIFKAIAAKPPVNDMLPVGPTNIVLLVPEGEIKPNGNISLILRYYAIWRLHTADGLYSTDMEYLTRPADSKGIKNGIYVAGGPSLEIGITAGKHFSSTLTTGIFIPGEYLRNTSKGETLQGVIARAYYRF